MKKVLSLNFFKLTKFQMFFSIQAIFTFSILKKDFWNVTKRAIVSAYRVTQALNFPSASVP